MKHINSLILGLTSIQTNLHIHSQSRRLPSRQRFLSLFGCALLIFLLGLSYPLAKTLPLSFGWENGAVENSQAGILFLGMMTALCFAFQNRKIPSGKLGLAMALLWFICFARELSWGAVFFPPLDISSHGPVFSSHSLWYKPAVYPIIALFAMGSFSLFFKHRLHRLLVQLIRKKRFPGVELGIVFLAMIISNFAEGHREIIGDHNQVLEELTELVAYLGLFFIQLQIFIQTRILKENL